MVLKEKIQGVSDEPHKCETHPHVSGRIHTSETPNTTLELKLPLKFLRWQSFQTRTVH